MIREISILLKQWPNQTQLVQVRTLNPQSWFFHNHSVPSHTIPLYFSKTKHPNIKKCHFPKSAVYLEQKQVQFLTSKLSFLIVNTLIWFIAKNINLILWFLYLYSKGMSFPNSVHIHVKLKALLLILPRLNQTKKLSCQSE